MGMASDSKEMLVQRFRVDGFIHLVLCACFSVAGIRTRDRLATFLLLVVISAAVSLRHSFSFLFLLWMSIFVVVGVGVGYVDPIAVRIPASIAVFIGGTISLSSFLKLTQISD
jgi:hypothetical protein